MGIYIYNIPNLYIYMYVQYEKLFRLQRRHEKHNHRFKEFPFGT